MTTLLSPRLAAETGWSGNQHRKGQDPHWGLRSCSVTLLGGWGPRHVLKSSMRVLGVCICLLHKGKSQHKKKNHCKTPFAVVVDPFHRTAEGMGSMAAAMHLTGAVLPNDILTED